jgi:hypothetical protein
MLRSGVPSLVGDHDNHKPLLSCHSINARYAGGASKSSLGVSEQGNEFGLTALLSSPAAPQLSVTDGTRRVAVVRRC